MEKIKLNNYEWNFDTSSQLGSGGGFGEVFKGNNELGEVAIKRLKINASEAAHRELDIVAELSNRKLKYIVPVIDYGQDSNSDRYFIVMPVCEYSLQDYIGEGIPVEEVINILLTILYGLDEIADITHRDLKPANILFHEGIWKIADFGIAKFVEDTTSLETLRSCLTPLYAAPEQWLLERPDNSTDIYAVACIAHTLINGRPPFIGDRDEIREQHLYKAPEPLNKLPTAARSIITLMLRKPREVRPKRKRCIEVLNKLLVDLKNSQEELPNSKLVSAVESLSRQQAAKEIAMKEMEEIKKKRNILFAGAKSELIAIRTRLFSEIHNHCQDIEIDYSSEDTIRIGNATFQFSSKDISGFINNIEEAFPKDERWGTRKRQSSWDFIALSAISLEQRITHKSYTQSAIPIKHKSYTQSATLITFESYTQSATLLFARDNISSEFRWYEMAFFSPLSSGEAPYMLRYPWEIDEVLSPGMGIYELAYHPVPIDGEDEHNFTSYWIDRFAMALEGKLSPPRSLPMER